MPQSPGNNDVAVQESGASGSTGDDVAYRQSVGEPDEEIRVLTENDVAQAEALSAEQKFYEEWMNGEDPDFAEVQRIVDECYAAEAAKLASRESCDADIDPALADSILDDFYKAELEENDELMELLRSLKLKEELDVDDEAEWAREHQSAHNEPPSQSTAKAPR